MPQSSVAAPLTADPEPSKVLVSPIDTRIGQIVAATMKYWDLEPTRFPEFAQNLLDAIDLVAAHKAAAEFNATDTIKAWLLEGESMVDVRSLLEEQTGRAWSHNQVMDALDIDSPAIRDMDECDWLLLESEMGSHGWLVSASRRLGVDRHTVRRIGSWYGKCEYNRSVATDEHVAAVEATAERRKAGLQLVHLSGRDFHAEMVQRGFTMTLAAAKTLKSRLTQAETPLLHLIPTATTGTA